MLAAHRLAHERAHAVKLRFRQAIHVRRELQHRVL
jgi:hypothetical protein